MWRTAKHAEPGLYHTCSNLEPSSSKNKTACFFYILWGEVGLDFRLHYASVAVPRQAKAPMEKKTKQKQNDFNQF